MITNVKFHVLMGREYIAFSQMVKGEGNLKTLRTLEMVHKGPNS